MNFDALFLLIAPVFRVVVGFYDLVLIDKARTDILKGQVRDVGDSRPIKRPIDFEGKAALNLKVETSLSEFVVQIPLVKSEATF